MQCRAIQGQELAGTCWLSAGILVNQFPAIISFFDLYRIRFEFVSQKEENKDQEREACLRTTLQGQRVRLTPTV
jgi:hypothetical protein